MAVKYPASDKHLRDRGAAAQLGAAGLVAVEPGQQRHPRRVALGRVVELREPQPVGRQRVEVRRLDLRAVTPQVGEAQVVGHDQHDVGSFGSCGQHRYCDHADCDRGDTKHGDDPRPLACIIRSGLRRIQTHRRFFHLDDIIPAGARRCVDAEHKSPRKRSLRVSRGWRPGLEQLFVDRLVALFLPPFGPGLFLLLEVLAGFSR